MTLHPRQPNSPLPLPDNVKINRCITLATIVSESFIHHSIEIKILDADTKFDLFTDF